MRVTLTPIVFAFETQFRIGVGFGLYYKYDILYIRCQAPQDRSAVGFIVHSTADCKSEISRTFFATASPITFVHL
jgi:hypothetical protein